jgi:hypothetical protein
MGERKMDYYFETKISYLRILTVTEGLKLIVMAVALGILIDQLY